MNTTIEDRKSIRPINLKQINLERIKAEPELARLWTKPKTENQNESDTEIHTSLDSQLKNVRILITKIKGRRLWTFF